MVNGLFRALRLGPALLSLALPAAADVFDDAAGTWGVEGDTALSCAENPHHVGFSADRSRASFRWESTMINYEGEPDIEGLYTVLGHGADEIVLALDGESRRTRDGRPVVWILRLREGGARYCWGRTDWDPGQCIDGYVRCPEPQPTSRLGVDDAPRPG